MQIVLRLNEEERQIIGELLHHNKIKKKWKEYKNPKDEDVKKFLKEIIIKGLFSLYYSISHRKSATDLVDFEIVVEQFE